jgi:hypothetical protein
MVPTLECIAIHDPAAPARAKRTSIRRAPLRRQLQCRRASSPDP